MNLTLEERVARLEYFIGNIDQIKAYANTLQEVIDRYLSPLYIEKTDNTGSTLFVDSYLGDTDNVPINSILKIRASHNLDMTGADDAELVLMNGSKEARFPMRKYVNGSLVKLESNNFVEGTIYDVYINGQSIAICTSSDTGIRALSEIDTLRKEIDEIQEFLGTLGSTDEGFNFEGSLTVDKIITKEAKVDNKLDISTVTNFSLPADTTISDPNNPTSVVNKKYTDKLVNDSLIDFFARKHLIGTSEASVAMEHRENDSFYFKIGD